MTNRLAFSRRTVDLVRQLIGNHLASQVRRRRSLNDELVFSQAILADVGHCDRGRLGAKGRQRQAGSVSREPIGQETPKFVLREVAEKSRRNAESSERARGVEWAAARRGAPGAVGAQDHVNQRFTTDENHGTICPILG